MIGLVIALIERAGLFFKSNKTLRNEIAEYENLKGRVHDYDAFYDARIEARENALSRRRLRRG